VDAVFTELYQLEKLGSSFMKESEMQFLVTQRIYSFSSSPTQSHQCQKLITTC